MRIKTLALDLQYDALWRRYQRLSPSRKFMLAVFMIWLIQALPKWTAAITADGEMSAQIMKIFITPRTESMSMGSKNDANSVGIYKPGTTGSYSNEQPITRPLQMAAV